MVTGTLPITADSLIDDFADALIAVTRDGHVLFWSRGAEKVFGFSREEVMGRSLVEMIVPPELREDQQRLIGTVLKTGSVTFEAVRNRKNGEIIYVDVSMQAVMDERGTTKYVAISKKDVTHLQYLREAAVVETKFRGLLEASPDAMVLVNPDGRIVQLNGRTETMFGYPREELLGLPVEVLVPDRLGHTQSTDRNTFLTDPMNRHFCPGPDLFGRRKDGTEFPVEITLGSVTMDQGVFTTAAVRDVSEQRKVEAKFRGFLDAAPDAVVIVNAQGTIVLVNSQTERLFGYQRSELIGQMVEMLIPDRFGERHPEHRDDYLSDRNARALESGFDLCGLRKDGSEFPAEISLSPLETEEGTLVSSTIRDITDRKATETSLKLVNKELEAFSYSVAHDLRAPLRGMNGFAQVLLDEYRDKLDADGVDSLNEIHRSAVRMGALIDALLSLSSVTRSDLKAQRVDLTALGHSVASDLAAANPNRDVEFVIEDKLHAFMDPFLARTLIENLFGNSLKFTAGVAHGRVEFGVVSKLGERMFFVHDNGVGFDMAHSGALFTPFQRLHTVTEFPGTGIGLATTQRIVHRHGGRIWGEGRVNGGATFYFVIPSRSSRAAA